MKEPKPVQCGSCGKVIKFSEVKGVGMSADGKLLQLCECGALLKFKMEEKK